MLFCLVLATLFFSFPFAARGRLLSPAHGQLLSPQNFSPLKTLRVVTFALISELFSSPHAACGDDIVLWSPCLHCAVRGTWCRYPAEHPPRGVEPCFQRRRSRPLLVVRFWLSCQRCVRALCGLSVPSRSLGWPIPCRLLCVATSATLVTNAAVAAFDHV